MSFIPLIPSQGWRGNASGDYTCSCGSYYLRFSDLSTGRDKPHIYTSYNGMEVDMVEVSDKDSSVGSLNMYSDFSFASGIRDGALVLSYSSLYLNFTRTVSVGNGIVNMSYDFSRNVTTQLTLWRAYYASIGQFDTPANRDLNAGGVINFTFIDQGALFNVSIFASPNPSRAQISGLAGAGLNKIVLEFNASKVDLSVKLTAVKPLAGAGVVEVAYSGYAYPIIGVSLAAGYLIVRRNTRSKPQFRLTRGV